MNKCHRISWEERDVGSTVGDSSLPLPVSVQYLCSAQQKLSFISPNMEIENVQSRVPHEQLGVAYQVIILYGSRR
jgi:hypothetical protein